MIVEQSWQDLRLAWRGLARARGFTPLRDLLFEVQPLDPATLTITALLSIGAAALACYLPTRRAVRIDPAKMLRAE
jgi:putative ABC transport system permease protein